MVGAGRTAQHTAPTNHPHTPQHTMNEQPQLFATPQTITTSDDYYTPKWIFDALGLHFDLDVASPPHATHVPCTRYLTMEDDGLTTPWEGRVWMNPPYSNPLPWVEKFVMHGNGVALVPTSNGRWFDILWNATSAWIHLKSLKFESPSGLMPQGIPNRVWLVAMGTDNIEALHNIGTVR